MGADAPEASNGNDARGAGVCFKKVRAVDGRICLEESGGVRLNLGAGHVKWPGWIAVGYGCEVEADLRALPFPDDHADGAVAIHVIEHIYRWDVLAVLQEWRRVLKPGASLSLECPCMDKVFRYIARLVETDNLRESKFMTSLALWGDPKYRDVSQCHKWGYFADELAELMRAAGFKDVRLEEPRYHFQMRDMRLTGTK